jgi:hypothetical protein
MSRATRASRCWNTNSTPGSLSCAVVHAIPSSPGRFGKRKFVAYHWPSVGALHTLPPRPIEDRIERAAPSPIRRLC